MATLLSENDSEIELGERPANSSHLPEQSQSTSLNHVSTVLGDAFYTQQRNKERLQYCLTQVPFPGFPASSVVLGVVCVLLIAALVVHSPSGYLNSTSGGSNESAEAAVDVLSAQAFTADYQGRARQVAASSGLVAADNGRCSDMGRAELQQGGNAVDAATTVALCLGVASPGSSGIGGGAFMLIRQPNGSAEVIDAREIAPAAATQDMFAGRPLAALQGGLGAAVPLELRGLWLAHQRHGSRPWAELVQPVADLARSGFPATPYLVHVLSNPDLREVMSSFPTLRQAYYKEGPSGVWRPPVINETCCARTRLADLLDDVALEGPDVLYNGSYTRGLVEDITKAGGIITEQDLGAAQPEVKPVIASKVWGLDIITAPPPSSGAVLVAALHILEGYVLPMAGAGEVAVHHLIEAMKNAFALRSHLGDPGSDGQFLNLTSLLEDAVSPDFGDLLRSEISDSATRNWTLYGGQWNMTAADPDDDGTTHFCVVDSSRMAVSMTSTVNTGFGSKVLSSSSGVLLNNDMDDFSTAQQANNYGLEPSKANYIQPGKKPLSSMSPTMLMDSSGALRIVVGASGGPRIITAVLQAIVRMLAFGWTPLEAVGTPRLHHQLLPDAVIYENVTRDWVPSLPANFTSSSADIEGLRQRGHNVSTGSVDANCQAILVDPDTSMLLGASDPRKDGAPAGY